MTSGMKVSVAEFKLDEKFDEASLEDTETRSLVSSSHHLTPALGAHSMKDYFREMERKEARGAGLSYQVSVIELPGIEDVFSPLPTDEDDEVAYMESDRKDSSEDSSDSPFSGRTRSGARLSGIAELSDRDLQLPTADLGAAARLETRLTSGEPLMGFAFASEVLAQAQRGELADATHRKLEQVMSPLPAADHSLVVSTGSATRVSLPAIGGRRMDGRPVTRDAGMSVHIGGHRAYEDLLDHLRVRKHAKRKKRASRSKVGSPLFGAVTASKRTSDMRMMSQRASSKLNLTSSPPSFYTSAAVVMMDARSVPKSSTRFSREKMRPMHMRSPSVTRVDASGERKIQLVESGEVVSGSPYESATLESTEEAMGGPTVDSSEEDGDEEAEDSSSGSESVEELSDSRTMAFDESLWRDCDGDGVSADGVEFKECDIVSIAMEAELLEGKRPDATRFSGLQYWFQFIQTRFSQEKEAELIMGTKLPPYVEWRTRRKVRGWRSQSLKDIDYALKNYLSCVDVMKAMIKNTLIMCYDNNQNSSIEFPGCRTPRICKGLFKCGPISIISAWRFFALGSSPSIEGWQRIINSDTPAQRFLQTLPDVTHALSAQSAMEATNFYYLRMFLQIALSEYMSKNLASMGCNKFVSWSDVVTSSSELSAKLKKCTGVWTMGSLSPKRKATPAPRSSVLPAAFTSKKSFKTRPKRSATIDALQTGILSMFEVQTFHVNPFVDNISELMLSGIPSEKKPSASDMMHSSGALKGAVIRSLNVANFVSDNKIIAEPMVWTIYLYRFLLDRQKKLYKLIAAAQAPAIQTMSAKIKHLMADLAKDARNESHRLRDLTSRLPAINELIDVFLNDVSSLRDASQLPLDCEYVQQFVTHKTEMFETHKDNIEELAPTSSK